MTRVIFVRHCQSAPSPGVPQEFWPLTEKGRGQAQDLVPILAELGVTALASSPYLRTIETLRPFADATGLTIHIDEDLRERSFGGWIEDVEAINEAVRRMHADPSYALEGGESAQVCLARFQAGIERAVRAHPHGTLAIGSHGGILSHLLARHPGGFTGEFWRRIRNPHLFLFDYAPGPRWIGERTLDGVPYVAASKGKP